MATKTWTATSGNNWSTGANWGGTKPANGDDVVMGAGSGNCVVDEASANLKSFDMTGYDGTLSSTFAINVIGAASSTVPVKLAGTITWTGTLNLNPTAADTNIELTSNSKTIASLGINGNASGDVFFLDGTTITTSLSVTSGVFHSDGLTDNSGLTHTWERCVFNGTNTINLGASTINITGSGSVGYAVFWPRSFTSFSAGSSTINFTAATYHSYGQLATDNANYTLGTVNATGAGSFYIYSNSGTKTITFGTFNRTGTAVKTDSLRLEYRISLTITGTLNLDGNSGVNRLLVYGNTLGTANTITVTGATVSGSSNVDFRDITFTGSPDFSGITGGSGDCGGNTGATFTTADDWYWYSDNGGSNTAYNWSDYSHWYQENAHTNQMGSARTILPQDNAFINADSINGAGTTTIDQDLPRVGKTIDFSNVDPVAFHTDNIAQTFYGSYLLSSNVTPTAGNISLTFEGRDAFQLNLAGKTYSSSFNINTVSGGITLLNHLNISTRTLTLNNGSFNADSYNVTCGNFTSSSNSKTLLMGSGSWTSGTTTGTAWNLPSTGLTNPTTVGGTSTLTLTPRTNAISTFVGGGATYNNVTINAGSALYPVTINEGNTFNALTITAPNAIKLTAGTTQTVSSFVATGTSGNLIVIDNTTETGASPAVLRDTSGTNTLAYCIIGTTYNVNVEGGATWNALPTDNNTITSGTGWTTTAGTYTSQYPPTQNATYVKATNERAGDFYAYNATDSAGLLTGASSAGYEWATANTYNSNMRFHIDLGSAKVIKRIYYENGHNGGANTDRGVENFVLQGSNTDTAFAELTYATDTNWTALTTSQTTFDQHSAADARDPKYITITNTTAYRYYALKFADNYGDASLMDLRRIVLQTEDTAPSGGTTIIPLRMLMGVGI